MSNILRLENQQICDISFEENAFHGLGIILTIRKRCWANRYFYPYKNHGVQLSI